MPKVGFVGLGNIGGPIAMCLLDRGYELSVCDLNPEATIPFRTRGAAISETPAAVASDAEIVLVSLPGPAAVEAVALGSDGLVNGGALKVYVDLSTTGAQKAAQVATELGKKHIAAVDAPVTGGVRSAKQGALTLMVSGAFEAVEKVRPVLEAVSSKIYYVGDRAGSGQMMKLINNLLSATALATTCEALVLGVKYGLDPATMVEVLNDGSGRNSATEQKVPSYILPRTFNAGFTTQLMNKDLRLCMDEADALSVPMWIGSAVRQMWAFAASQDGADRDITTVIQKLESWAGVTVGEQNR